MQYLNMQCVCCDMLYLFILYIVMLDDECRLFIASYVPYIVRQCYIVVDISLAESCACSFLHVAAYLLILHYETQFKSLRGY